MPARLSMPRVHLWIGLGSLVVFVLQGQYMAWGLSFLHDVPDGPRMLYRSAHLYLFLTGAINIALGTHTQTQSSPDKLTWITSVLIMVSPVIMLISFFTESHAADLNRPLCAVGLQLVFAAETVRALRALGWREKPD